LGKIMHDAIKQLIKAYYLFLRFPKVHSQTYINALFLAKMMITIELLCHHPKLPFADAERKVDEWVVELLHRQFLRSPFHDTE